MNLDSSMGPYRALDLTEGGFNWCGKVLADLGADVIKIEPPRGSDTRYRAPFYNDEPHPERSLFWYAYCVNKRGITLNLETGDGRELFKRLVAGADFVLESFPPGYMAGLGLGYEDLSRINPRLVVTSMTPYGQTGPHSLHKTTDMVSWSMGGMQYLTGEEDRAPLRITFPQAEFLCGAQAYAGSMTAFWHRQNTGEGQHVDVSTQVAVIWTLMNATAYPKLHKVNVERAGIYHGAGLVEIRTVFPCKDGYIALTFGGGLFGPSTSALVRWMDEESMAPGFMVERDWPAWDFADIAGQGEKGAAEVRAIEGHMTRFFGTKTKSQLYQRAFNDRILIGPCNNVKDIWEYEQLRARGFYIEVHHPELQVSLPYLGPYVKLGESPIQIRRPAPGIGEHNDEIFGDELGLTRDELLQLEGIGAV